ncbi:MAG: hypothetical protein A2667_03480 [Candidatus Wildermuthbacteria bacterium RIFCSPHIGHO2_01_FULL_47_27]|uniref:Type 4a pilus biogenesis protein PilO n=2 Tax=Candidatus Wildermuthiibacteriota TaxID=1817923 RepID=A0A1G2RMI3_9BACT|nr:MAG: hypothetical protein UY15_C0008G0015 [Parcubacteria group bacterium GW2011_GWA2_47_9]OHA63528.1 MAG: hypothetical protein A2667_03480 [Candidatus Wildermuthbacteria bacterium RIFCSPHIGHO2_01_FULL_47_27]OHA67520.1 MAG: hypothetical protein A3D59_03835 [Candidatus Wildermuthbacteria bacterium RIFCSPHIGHO2_02_FULL_47_17]OHA74075.1 MAG: hypothetical protein A3A32_02165 [Candidatus Wildermuthbacteria bacterium RIFCSPLOWO2_01_FULL_48_35]
MIINRSIFTVILLLGGIAISFFFTWPAYQDLRVKSRELKNVKTELGYISEYYKHIEDTSARLAQYKPVLDKMDSALPRDISFPALLNYFQNITSQNGLVASGLGMPSAGTPAESGIKDVKLGLSLIGSYQSLKNLMASLYRNAKMIEIDGLSFSAPDKDGLFNFRLETKTHSY